MDERIYRILALGRGAALDQAVAGMTGGGFAVAQVDQVEVATRLLKEGDINLVVADGESEALPKLIRADIRNRPWLVVEHPGGTVAPDEADSLTWPVSTDQLCNEIVTMIRMHEAEVGAAHPKEQVAKG